MGYKLYREILDHAPLDWTPAERLVALIIADSANDDTRKAYALPLAGTFRTKSGTREEYWQDGITERAGLTADGVRRVFQRLAERGFEFRVAVKDGSDGRPVYATKGRSLDFVVPPIPEGRPEKSPRPARDRSKPKGGTDVLPCEGGTLVLPKTSKAGRSSAKAGRSSRPFTQVPSQTSSPQMAESQRKAPRRARALRDAGASNPPDVISEVRRAAVDRYGEQAQNLTDEQCATMYRRFCCDRTGKPRPVKTSVYAYLSNKPFADVPDLASALRPKRPRTKVAPEVREEYDQSRNADRVKIIACLVDDFEGDEELAVIDMVARQVPLSTILAALESGVLIGPAWRKPAA